MSSYKKNAASDRDALFGNAAAAAAAVGSGSKKTKKKPSSSRSSAGKASAAAAPKQSTSKGYTSKNPTKSAVPSLSPEVKQAKLKEAEDYKTKANKCMESGFFKKPDPVAASTYFKRAADAYQKLGETQRERLYRIESAQCNMQCGAWASAAGDYTRAAALLDVDTDVARRDAAGYHKQAAKAWTEANEKAKAAACLVEASIALHQGTASTILSKEALTAMEEAIEAHVPDPLNPYARYRQTGHSAFIDPDSDETAETCRPETIELAKNHIVTRSYAYEPLQQLCHMLTGYGEYASALYAGGAAVTILTSDGLSTLSVSRQFLQETILLLAMGDAVAADAAFLNRHVQKTFYLSSRECQLAEELIRAVKFRDADALDATRSPSGPNRAALANLPHENWRTVVKELRISGVARKRDTKDSNSTNENDNKPLADILSMKTGYEQDVAAGANMDAGALAAELDDLDFGELDDSEDVGNDELDELEDDDLDLR